MLPALSEISVRSVAAVGAVPVTPPAPLLTNRSWLATSETVVGRLPVAFRLPVTLAVVVGSVTVNVPSGIVKFCNTPGTTLKLLSMPNP